LTEDGQIMVDESIKFRAERREWNKQGAFISA
jgi:hypothetical protein